MKMPSILMSALACAWLTGCASDSNQTSIETVGPKPVGPANPSDNGTLIVYSAFATDADFYNSNPFGRRYTNYKILTADGHLYERVQNNNGTLMQDALPVSLPPGNYQVNAESNGHGKLKVPVAIAAHQTTILHLEGGGFWQQREGLDQTNAVRLPSGEIIGYRMDANAN
jgi:hypothetical protein